jgi:recombinational DNA repair ATPase RecF
MVDSLTIRNFRSFREVKLENCRRINLVVGDNGSGKTALLEALFLAAGISPELAIRTRGWRGYEGERMSGSHEDLHQALWADLFHKFQTNRTAVITLRGKGEENRTVEIRLFRQDQLKLIVPRRDRPGMRPSVVPQATPFQFRYKIGDQTPFDIEPYFEGERLGPVFS